MEFGKVDTPELIDFSLPTDHPDTERILKTQNSTGKMTVYVGCAKWGKKDLKTFYPRGTKDELSYYSKQFNSIELNATFYGNKTVQQIETWRDKTPENFKFFPKIPQYISHIKRINQVDKFVKEFYNLISAFHEKLGVIFLQMPENFSSKYINRVKDFIEYFPDKDKLAVELRNKAFYEDKNIADELHTILEQHKVTNIITDSAGRRDMVHMRLTSPKAFIRYVGSNIPSDYSRLDDWLERIIKWEKAGLKELYFFVHQNKEEASPDLAAHFIRNLNKKLDYNLTEPVCINQSNVLKF